MKSTKVQTLGAYHSTINLWIILSVCIYELLAEYIHISLWVEESPTCFDWNLLYARGGVICAEGWHFSAFHYDIYRERALNTVRKGRTSIEEEVKFVCSLKPYNIKRKPATTRIRQIISGLKLYILPQKWIYATNIIGCGKSSRRSCSTSGKEYSHRYFN